jgi:hypothetical protein
MSRRISTTVEKINGYVAIQPRQDEQIKRLLEAILATLESQSGNIHQGMTVIHVSSTKEVVIEGGTVISRVDHEEETLTIYIPANTANKEVAGGSETPLPKESDHRLVKLIKALLKKLLQLLDLFTQEAVKELGKAFAKFLLILLLVYYLSQSGTFK